MTQERGTVMNDDGSREYEDRWLLTDGFDASYQRAKRTHMDKLHAVVTARGLVLDTGSVVWGVEDNGDGTASLRCTYRATSVQVIAERAAARKLKKLGRR